MRLQEEATLTFLVECRGYLKSFHNQETGETFKIKRLGFKGKVDGKQGILNVGPYKAFLSVIPTPVGIATYCISHYSLNFTSIELITGLYLSSRLLNKIELDELIKQFYNSDINKFDIMPLVLYAQSNSIETTKMVKVRARINADNPGESVAAKYMYVKLLKTQLK